METWRDLDSNAPDWNGGASIPAKATNTSKGYQRFLVFEPPNITDFGHKSRTSNGSGSFHLHHNLVFGKHCSQPLHFELGTLLGLANGIQALTSLCDQHLRTLAFRKSSYAFLCKQIDFVSGICAELVVFSFAPAPIRFCESLHGILTDTILVPISKASFSCFACAGKRCAAVSRKSRER